MRKPQLFRDAIAAAFPQFDGKSRDKLAVYVENGRVRARPSHDAPGAVSGFEWAYRLEAVLLDFKGDPNLVLATALDWIAQYQPELLQSHEGAPIELQADIVDDERVDLQLSIELSEAVTRTEQGFDYLPEPAIETAFAGVGDPADLQSIVVNAEELAP